MPDTASAAAVSATLFEIEGHATPLPDGGLVRPFYASHSGDNISLDDAAISVDAGTYDGRFEIHEGHAVGWVTERRLNSPPIELTISDQFDRIVAREHVTAESGPSDSLFNPVHFRISLIDACFGGQELWLTARANGVPFATSSCKLSLTGTLELLSESRCAGWVFSPDAPGRNFEIEIFRNGDRIATARTDQDRADVTAVFANAATPGFDVDMPIDEFRPSELAAVSLRLAGGTTELFEGPYIIGPRTAVVSAARSVARHALAGNTGISDIEAAI